MDGDKFTREDVYACWGQWFESYFLDIMNGKYDIEDARNDLKSLVGSKYDIRTLSDSPEVK